MIDLLKSDAKKNDPLGNASLFFASFKILRHSRSLCKTSFLYMKQNETFCLDAKQHFLKKKMTIGQKKNEVAIINQKKDETAWLELQKQRIVR